MTYQKIVNISISLLLVIGVGSASAREKFLLPAPVSDNDFYITKDDNPAQVELGKFLFYDKILSGNKNISCATCHHSLTDTGDGLSLPVGEGGKGLGVTRNTGNRRHAIVERVPRNAPPVFNLGANEYIAMFYDGRVEFDPSYPSSCLSPAGDDLPEGLDGPLACQAAFPVTSPAEMAGQRGENKVANAAANGNLPRVWNLLTKRLRRNSEYVQLFKAAYPEEIQKKGHITFTHVANAIAAYEAVAFRADNSPFDQYLRGNRKALSKSAKKGMRLFYGKAQCGTCHTGKFQTDHSFHATAMPQIGPGKGHGQSGHEDFGREDVTGDVEDRFKFRTPSLRNIALTAPYGHDGAYDTLEAMVRHQLDSVVAINSYDKEQVSLPSRKDLDQIDFQVQDNETLVGNIAAANELESVELSDKQFRNLMAFLHALTDPNSLDLRKTVPKKVPSKLRLYD
jgi:cytochrome c peroxidase